MRRLGRTCVIATAVIWAMLASWPQSLAQPPEPTSDPVGQVEDAAAPEPPPIELVLRSDQETYAIGDVPSYFARASEDCYLTLINVDTDGSAVVLFPNEFERDNRLKAGDELKLPMQSSPYRFRLTRQGRERLIGICTQSPRPVAGISHDFERLRFTVLGNWDEFLSAVENGPPANEPSRSGKRGKRGRAKTRPNADEPEAPLPPDRQARAEISYEVR